MVPHRLLQSDRWRWLPWAVIAATTLVAIALSIFCLSSEYFIIFQNAFYIPIIIACIFYGMRGFVFSVVIAIFYYYLTLFFTHETTILLQAFVRSLIFVLIAGILTYLSLLYKRATEALRKNRDLLFEMTTRVPGVVYQFYARPNGERGLYYVSPSSEQLFGLKPELEKFFEGFTALVIPEDREDFLRSIEKSVREMSAWKFEGRLRKLSGETVWFSGSSIPLFRNHEIIFDGIIMDISERKRVEEERRRLDALVAIAEVKAKFATMVSHELRSPLSVIKGALDIILEGLMGKVNDEQKDILDIAKRNTDRLGRLINNVLDFQRIESEKMAFDFQTHDLNEVVTEVLEGMRILSKRKGLDLRAELEEGLPKIKFDKDKIIQVLMNLVSNAIKNTASGSVALETQKDPEALHIKVRDSGRGIPTEDLRKIFMPFERVDVPGEQEKEGTGLGLAISKELVLGHQGKIWAESKVGSGTTVHITLPLFQIQLK